MVQDTSPSPEMYLATRSGGRCGGWGLADESLADSAVDYSNLRENTVVWVVSVPGESAWVGTEMDGVQGAYHKKNYGWRANVVSSG
jgi:hypothetical protein